ncbi:MAG: oligosaccharide flippase family protein [Clostridia bacterium]|nr:oligosaccharide flippase family protein [Clostridia bacterium]
MSEIAVKVITPVLNAVLARILLPADYAPLTTIMMLISFCEVFVESGFRKYLIQHKFEDETEENQSFHVAFWTTLTISVLIWILILFFCKPISTFLGNSEIWCAVAISGLILPLYAMTGVFDASIHKRLAFKKVFIIRVITALIPLIITIPLAMIGLKYWSLVIGNIASVFAQMVISKHQSGYRIKFFYSVKLLRRMFSDTVWTLMDGIAVWLTAWVDSLIITQYMTEYYLGLYKNSLNTVNSLYAMITASVFPVLFVGLTKCQNDKKKFVSLFVSTQQMLAMLLIPLGVGVFLYRDLAVDILFGEQWREAADVVGITAFTLAVRAVYVSIFSDAYRAKGAYRIPFVLQVVDVCFLIPICVVSAKNGFWCLVYARSFARLALIVPELFVMKKYLQIDVKTLLQNQWPIWISTAVMAVMCLILQTVNKTVMWDIISIVLACLVYASMLLLIPSTRQNVKKMFRKR